MPVLWKLFDFIANNKYAQWALAIVSGLALYKTYERLRDIRIRKEVREEARDNVIEQIEEQTHDRVEDAREAASSTDDLNADQLRKLRAADPNNRSRLP